MLSLWVEYGSITTAARARGGDEMMDELDELGPGEIDIEVIRRYLHGGGIPSPGLALSLLEEIEELRRALEGSGQGNLAFAQGETLCKPAHRITMACAVPDCKFIRTGQSPYCKMHAMRAKRHGDPTIRLKPWDKKKGHIS